MSENIEEELTEYEKFRLQKAGNRKQDDNFSAHFSNFSVNMSLLSKSERDIHIHSFRSGFENQEDTLALRKQLQEKASNYDALLNEHQELKKRYQALKVQMSQKQSEANKYKRLYEAEINRQRETKLKLKNWVSQAKNNLRT